jgi:hypothetical protein
MATTRSPSPRATPAATSTSPSRAAVQPDTRSSADAHRALAAHVAKGARMAARQETVQRVANRTGLPDGLKHGIESLSNVSLDAVRVHYNSSKPAQLSAHAYAQGTDIHVSPGQERHVPHEAWHVVQQAQGRVAPTLRARGVAINDDHRLEREADVMGAQAAKTVAQRAAKKKEKPKR